MPLSARLLPVALTFECPFCKHPLVKSGGWFQMAASFWCAGCHREVRLTYSDKLVLFEKHAHLALR
jgi:transposase-like protein